MRQRSIGINDTYGEPWGSATAYTAKTPEQIAKTWAWVDAWRTLTPAEQAAWHKLPKERKRELDKMTPADMIRAVKQHLAEQSEDVLDFGASLEAGHGS